MVVKPQDPSALAVGGCILNLHVDKYGMLKAWCEEREATSRQTYPSPQPHTKP